MSTMQTLASLLAPIKTSVIAEKTGCSRVAVGAWKAGKAIPDVSRLPELAALLRYDLGDLTRLIAADADRIAQSREAVA